MKKFIYILMLMILPIKAHSHLAHYAKIKKIEMDVIRNGEVIGYTNYYFKHNDKKMTVKNYTKFKVELFGITVFSILSESEERYENNKLIFYKSNTLQNEKKNMLI
tara:strand:- start:117 stop:434 length:318 start_codon:yes stop_codon:yes gene_type:complete